jgi:hypothetical protein
MGCSSFLCVCKKTKVMVQISPLHTSPFRNSARPFFFLLYFQHSPPPPSMGCCPVHHVYRPVPGLEPGHRPMGKQKPRKQGRSTGAQRQKHQRLRNAMNTRTQHEQPTCPCVPHLPTSLQR